MFFLQYISISWRKILTDIFFVYDLSVIFKEEDKLRKNKLQNSCELTVLDQLRKI